MIALRVRGSAELARRLVVHLAGPCGLVLYQGRLRNVAPISLGTFGAGETERLVLEATLPQDPTHTTEASYGAAVKLAYVVTAS